jgi:hypothetical protein
LLESRDSKHGMCNWPPCCPCPPRAQPAAAKKGRCSAAANRCRHAQ